MKKKLVMTLMLTCAFSSGFADDSTVSKLANRADLVKEAGSDAKKLIETVNKKQQEGDIKVNNENYIVVIEKRKEGDTNVFTRVAHSKKEKVGQKVDESVLLDVLKNAEDALKSGDGPVRIQFNVDGKTLYALVSRCGDFLIFNVCSDEKEVNNFLGGNKPEVKQKESKPEKVEEKPVEKAQPKLDGDDKPKENTPDKAKITDEAIAPKKEEPQAKKSEVDDSTTAKESSQN